MLQAIKENTTAEFVSFYPKKNRRFLYSSRNEYLDLLKRKVNELQSSHKIKIPEALQKYKIMKKMKEKAPNYSEFPCLQKIAQRIRSLNLTPCLKQSTLLVNLEPPSRDFIIRKVETIKYRNISLC